MLRKGLNKRRLAAAIGACLMVPSAALHALGMGEIDVHSSLNQPLNATIRLISVDPQELESLDVSLAPKAAFERMGLDRMPVLSKLDFQVVTENGTPVIKVTSKVPVREPFLDFILSVNWANGQLLREYTLLLDPPVFDKGEAAPAPIQAAATAPATIVRDAREEFERIATEEVRFTAGEGSYGPTKTSDTLWTVAKKMRPDPSVSVPQMMLALLKENPEAFIDNNVNNLKAGYILRAPDMETILALSKTQAAAEVNRQYQQWLQQRRGGRPSGVGQRQIAAGEGGGAPAPGGAPEGPAPAPVAASEARLQLVSPEDAEFGGEVGGGDGQVAALERQLTLALESVEVTRQENAELRARLAELEKQLANMQRLLTLQDGTMSALQGGLARQEAERQGLAEADVAASQPDAAAAPVAQAPATTEEAATGGAAVSPEGAEEAAATQAQVHSEETRQEPEPVAPAVPLAAERSFIDDLMANPNTLLVGGGVGVLALLLIAMMVRRRRQAAEEDLFDSPLSATVPAAAAGAAAAGAAAGVAVAAEDDGGKERKEGGSSSGGFVEHDGDDGLGESVAEIDEYAGFGDDLGTIHAEESEIDPIAEADVYLAYRRYEQAESLLKEAIQSDEERHELKLKLMEIYHTTKDKEAFEAQAEALYAALGGEEDELWRQAVEMGRDLCPDHPLFSDSGALLEESEDGVLDLREPDGEVRSDGDDIDFESLAEPEPAPAADRSEEVAEFDLDDLSREETQSFDLDLDLDDRALEGAPRDEGDAAARGREEDDGFVAGAASAVAGSQFREAGAEPPRGEFVPGPDEELDVDAMEERGSDAAKPDLGPEQTAATGASLGEEVESGLSDLSSLDRREPGNNAAVDDAVLDLDLDLDRSVREAEQAVAHDGEEVSAEGEAHSPAVAKESGGGRREEELDLDDLDNIVNFEAPEGGVDERFDLSVDELADLDGDLDELTSSLGREADEMVSGSTTGQEPEGRKREEAADTTAVQGEEAGWEVEPALSSFGDSEEEYSLFESTDDVVGTKLDLAKAYIDMGDQDGARSILDEVVKEGSDLQRQEAEQLMRQIG